MVRIRFTSFKSRLIALIGDDNTDNSGLEGFHNNLNLIIIIIFDETDMNMNMPMMILIGFDVYLHEKDQFWPRQGSSDHGDKVPSKITLMDGKLKRLNH